jgi:Fe-S cluster biogenesis protein NfuA
MDSTENKVKKIIKENVNPILEQHFGASELSAYEDCVVYVRMTGACGSCPSAQSSVEDIVKAEIMARMPEIKDVILDTSVSEDLLDMARKILNKDLN